MFLPCATPLALFPLRILHRASECAIPLLPLSYPWCPYFAVQLLLGPGDAQAPSQGAKRSREGADMCGQV